MALTEPADLHQLGDATYARLDEGEYPKVEVSDAELAAVNLSRDEFHPEWNYTISPSPR